MAHSALLIALLVSAARPCDPKPPADVPERDAVVLAILDSLDPQTGKLLKSWYGDKLEVVTSRMVGFAAHARPTPENVGDVLLAAYTDEATGRVVRRALLRHMIFVVPRAVRTGTPVPAADAVEMREMARKLGDDPS